MKMKNIFYLIIAVLSVTCVSCNNEWEDEQFKQLVSFKANPNSYGVTNIYVRYNSGGKVNFDLPILLSGSTMTPKDIAVSTVVDKDTLNILNYERFGERSELYFKELDNQYYSFPQTVDIKKGECSTVLPISFTLGGQDGSSQLDMTEKWVLPLSIADDPSNNYVANPRKYYRKALLNIIPFNDYSGSYSATSCKIYLDGDNSHAFTVADKSAYVHDDKSVFIYAGLRNIDYLDRSKYRVFIRFTDEKIDIQKRKLELWSDNADPTVGNAFSVGSQQSYYTMEEEPDPKRPYLIHKYITLYIYYSFEDYTISPGNRLKYQVEGTMSMQRDINTLIPDEDQQIQWN